MIKKTLHLVSALRPVAGAETEAAKRSKKMRELASWRAIAFAGYVIIGLTFGVAGVWASVAKLDKAVVAPGYVETESNRKTIEHFEGGIVREILVKEGEHVAEGQVLFRLQKVQAEAGSEMAQNQLDAALALEARLIAERDHAAQITWPKELLDLERDPVVAGVMTDQSKQFAERHASMNDQIKVLEARIDEMQQEIDGIAVEKMT